MADLEKTFTFRTDRKVVAAKMTPEQRAAAWEHRFSNATSRDFIHGRVF